MAQVSYGTITITDTTDIEDVFLIYKGSSSNTVAPSITWSGATNDWKTDITQVTGDYIWAITVFKRTGITITSSNYTDYYSDPVCLTGEPGTSITITSIKYSTATTQTQPADSTFTLNSPPTVPEGGWLWSRTLFSSGQSIYSKAKQGEDGVSPTVSKTGDTVTITDAEGNTVTVTDGANGQSYYTYIRYATDSSGSGMVTTPTSSTKYIGVYSGTSATAPTSASSYTWSKYVGDNGTSVSISSIKYAKSTTDSQPADSSFGTTMPSVGEGEWLWTMTTYSNGSKVYTKSKQGISGTSVTVTKTEYQSGTSPTTAPTGTWSTTIPSVAEGNYLWTKTTYSDGNYSYTVAKQGQSGTSVTITSTSVQYQIGTSATTAPTGTWQDTVQATTTGQYLWTRTIVNYSNNTSTTSYSVSAHGATGTSISISSIKYAKSTTDSQPADSSFGTTIPAVGEGEWLWTMTTYSNGSKMYTKSKQGATGPQGISVTAVRELYYLTTSNAPSKPTSSTTIYDYDVVGAWTSVVPEYIVNGNYYTSLETTLSNSTQTWSDVVLDQATTDANYNAYLAQSLAQHANEDAHGAMSQVTATQYELEALDAKLKYFFWPGDSNYPGVYAASGISGTTFNEGSISTYGYNVSIKPASIGIGYNNIKAILIDGSNPSLKFYAPSKTEQAVNPSMELTSSSLIFNKIGTANKSVELTDSVLNFYGSSTSTPDAQLSSTGLQISNGAIIIGSTSGTSAGNVTLSNSDFTRSINGTSRSNLRLAIGQYFGVKNDGTLYATNADISGKITASSLTIGSGATVSGLSTSNISGINDYALQSSLDTEIAQRKAVYAVSTTGPTTATKTTESGTPAGFVLYNGATVTVKFNSANSTTTPTLNVNGTGAKTIKSYTGAALTAAEYTWPAGAAITFTYDGSYWRMQDGGALQAKADAAASASNASGSATAASNSASAASTSANSASTSASNASNSASAASTSASTASTKASEASDSASIASTQASAASTSATNAANSASAASTSATNASNSASAAADSASDASDSADAAAGSASTASSKATAAANSATSASNSASSASNSATSASNSASSASSSATTATNQATAAAGSATAASNSATAASGSATAASNSATAASNSATAASDSATAASNSATAAAEVMGGFTILWNYSAFGTSTAGDAFICGFDPATGTKSDANGWVKWNSTKRTITKQQVNPGTIVPYNIPIYIVCRLSSATGTTGTNYMVWYNAGWKYAACPSPTAVGGSWTWTDNRDIILGSFVETGANEVLTECELFNPPWTSKQITTNTTTPTSYIMDTDSNKGITVKPKDSSGNDFLQMNSTAIEFFRNSTTNSVMRLTDSSFRLGLEASNHTTIDTNGLHIWSGTESTSTNEVALFSTTARIGKSNNSRFLMNATSLQAYNSSNQLYFEVSSSGMTYGNNTVASTTYADGKANAAQTAAETTAQGYANDASYLVEVEVRDINYVTPTATLFAHVYYKGVELTSSTDPLISTISFQWKKVVKNSGAYNVTNINGATNQSLVTDDLDTTYFCVISK